MYQAYGVSPGQAEKYAHNGEVFKREFKNSLPILKTL